MTAKPPGDDWGEDRLFEAFAARAAKAPASPAGLTEEVLARVAAVDRGGLRWPALAAAAAVIFLAAIVSGTSILDHLRTGPSAAPSVPTVGATGDPPTTPAPTSAVLAALGDPLSVTEAQEVRDSEHGDREIVVEGFLSPVPAMFCALEDAPINPTRPRCPESYQWLMEEPEEMPAKDRMTPTGPAINPSFALVEAPSVPVPDEASGAPLPVVLVGHFHDRRAELCLEADVKYCGETFVVDRVLSIDGVEQPVRTWRIEDATTKDAEDVVDGLVAAAAPNAIVLSRQLLTLEPIYDIEPILVNDMVIPAWGDRRQLTWLVTTVDLLDGAAVPRTFMLLDGSNWFAELTADLAAMLEREAAGPSNSLEPVLPPGDRAAFDFAPSSVLGIPVRDIATTERLRQGAMGGLGRDELAIRAWYIGPNPAFTCPDQLPPLHAPLPPCDEARHWLLDDPQQYGVELGQPRTNPATDRWPLVLNPVIPIDVPFDVGPTWNGDAPVPLPVVMLGHFTDNRVDTYAGNVYFVIDAVAWVRDRPSVDLASLVRLTPDATEDVASVLSRIDAVAPEEPVVTWITVVASKDFAAIDRRADELVEFTSGPPIWIVRRLIHDERDGRQRLAIQWAWTADGGSRIWWTEGPDHGPDLATPIELHDLDRYTPLVRLFDYDQVVVAVDDAVGLSGLEWHQPHGNATDGYDVARGRNDREVVLRWTGTACIQTPHVEIREFEEGRIYIVPFVRGESCEGETLIRRIVIEFEESIEIDRIEGFSCCG
jgi:hypothetical protein